MLFRSEDNNEFRSFLYKELSGKYNVYEAANAEIAETIINDKKIDIVISDIMMPGITGLEFCRKIKNNIRTSHIFVILLTARIGDDYELRGYEFGADCYLTKPFNIDILFNRINHFIELQKKRNRNFLQEYQISGAEHSYSKVDAPFINKSIECLEKNIGDENYSV